jgi:hypothetical protein
MKEWSTGVLGKEKISFTYVLGSSITPLLQYSNTLTSIHFRE